MVIEVKEKVEKTRHVKNIDSFKKYVPRGGRNTRHHDRIPFIKQISYNFT